MCQTDRPRKSVRCKATLKTAATAIARQARRRLRLDPRAGRRGGGDPLVGVGR